MEFQPMSPDEIERTMQFILQQQAKFEANIETLSEKTHRMTEAIVGLTGVVGHLHGAQQRTDERWKETDERFRRTDARISDLGDYIKSVESHLNVVTDMFERHLREDHGHRPS